MDSFCHSDRYYLDDAIYFKGNFYGCLHTGGIVLCEATHPKVVELAPPPPDLPEFISTVTYLFDHLDGNLCIACRRTHSYAFTVGFDISKLDIDTKTWEKIYSLGDRSLFLGNCSTFAIAAADYPGCKPNCIYYSVDSPLLAATPYIDMGIYDCQNMTLEKDRGDQAWTLVDLKYPLDDAICFKGKFYGTRCTGEIVPSEDLRGVHPKIVELIVYK
ncbi:hypothetical protein Gotri_004991 [Gossypium trilobum]|uniref:KIB1-4 beta-propeller domain-containing protein n=1 Tax=Gossypium trilobum TaxID=34281 RepID=A0A7J9F6M1_9ROSI|nr:hypothetical protein [Gossypium trilobum]